MPVSFSDRSTTGRFDKEIVDWQAGAPVFEGEVLPAPATATEVPRGLAWILKPGDLFCDWLRISDADSRGLARLFFNLTVYAKAAVALAYFAS